LKNEIFKQDIRLRKAKPPGGNPNGDSLDRAPRDLELAGNSDPHLPVEDIHGFCWDKRAKTICRRDPGFGS
jgi:hypothetical protein